MKSLTQYILESSVSQTTLYFAGMPQLVMFIWEMFGQISDGKYENSRPYDHYKWLNNVEYKTCDAGQEHYAGPRHRRSYTIMEFAKKCNGKWEGSYGWCNRLQWYGAFGYVLDDLKATLKVSSDKDIIDLCVNDKHSLRYLLERYGAWQSDAEDPEDIDKFYEESSDYVREIIGKLGENAAYDICTKTRHAVLEKYDKATLVKDVKSMEETVNRWQD